MTRPILDEPRINPAIRKTVEGFYADTLREVQQAVTQHPVLVIGMAQNPFCRRVRKALDTAGVSHHYLEYGSYFSEWRRRSAIKMWSGWPTLPMVFVKGSLVGGATDVQALIASGELKRLLA